MKNLPLNNPRRRPKAAAAPAAYAPYTMTLPNGRTLYVEIPSRWTATDRSGQLALKPEGIRFLDRIRALALDPSAPPSSGYIRTLREALGMTQQEFGARLGAGRTTVAHWESGQSSMTARWLPSLQRIKRIARRSGIIIPEWNLGSASWRSTQTPR